MSVSDTRPDARPDAIDLRRRARTSRRHANFCRSRIRDNNEEQAALLTRYAEALELRADTQDAAAGAPPR
jgi:hypothetical protein